MAYRVIFMRRNNRGAFGRMVAIFRAPPGFRMPAAVPLIAFSRPACRGHFAEEPSGRLARLPSGSDSRSPWEATRTSNGKQTPQVSIENDDRRASFDLGQQRLSHMLRSYPFASRVAGNEIGISRGRGVATEPALGDSVMKRTTIALALLFSLLGASAAVLLSFGIGAVNARDADRNADITSRTFAAAQTAKQQCISTCRARYRDCRRLSQLPSFECRGVYRDCTRYTCTGSGPG
jgi:hypothetical protein